MVYGDCERTTEKPDYKAYTICINLQCRVPRGAIDQASLVSLNALLLEFANTCYTYKQHFPHHELSKEIEILTPTYNSVYCKSICARVVHTKRC